MWHNSILSAGRTRPAAAGRPFATVGPVSGRHRARGAPYPASDKTARWRGNTGLAVAMRSLPTGTSYAVWLGIGAALTVAYAMLTGDEAASPVKVVLIAGVIGCIPGLKRPEIAPRAYRRGARWVAARDDLGADDRRRTSRESPSAPTAPTATATNA